MHQGEGKVQERVEISFKDLGSHFSVLIMDEWRPKGDYISHSSCQILLLQGETEVSPSLFF